MQATDFITALSAVGVDHYFGVPDSLLAPLGDTLFARFGATGPHLIAANEGGAVGLAAGHYLATGRPACVYLQNSGLGNIVNPCASLLHKAVYGIPCLFVVGWRGKPGTPDEPQHVFQGAVTHSTLDLLEITHFTLTAHTPPEDLAAFLQQAKTLWAQGQCAAVVVEKGALTAPTAAYPNNHALTREDALRVILQNTAGLVVTTTGKTSREVFELREAMQTGHQKDFLTVGSMGHAIMIALGVARQTPAPVWCLDGDGAALMHLGSLRVAATAGRANLTHILFNNGAHESVGGLPIGGGPADFAALAAALGYGSACRADTADSLAAALNAAPGEPGTAFIEVMVQNGSRPDLGRPTTTARENKEAFMKSIRDMKAAAG